MIAAQGAAMCLLDALRNHPKKGHLLPYVFDAIASLVVGNERNALEISNLGGIQLILACVDSNKSSGDLVKSGFHALAIISDVQGQVILSSIER